MIYSLLEFFYFLLYSKNIKPDIKKNNIYLYSLEDRSETKQQQKITFMLVSIILKIFT